MPRSVGFVTIDHVHEIAEGPLARKAIAGNAAGDEGAGPEHDERSERLAAAHGLALPNAAQSAASVMKAVTQPIVRNTSRPRKPSIRANTLGIAVSRLITRPGKQPELAAGLIRIKRWSLLAVQFTMARGLAQ